MLIIHHSKNTYLQAKTSSHRQRRKRSICHKWLLELRGVSTPLFQLWPLFWSRRLRRWAWVGSTGWAQGLDVGSAGLFWLRGVGLRKHAKLAVSSKRIGESRELSWNLLFHSPPLSVWFWLSQAFSNDDFICLPLEGRGEAAAGPAARRYRHRNSCFFLQLCFSCQC